MFHPYVRHARRLAAPLTLSLLLALAGATAASARPAPDEPAATPDPTAAAHASSNLTWGGTTLIIAVGIAAVAVIAFAALGASLRHRRPLATH